jgi:HEAT repeat protein
MFLSRENADRIEAAKVLSESRFEVTQQILEERLKVEPSAEVRAAFKAALEQLGATADAALAPDSQAPDGPSPEDILQSNDVERILGLLNEIPDPSVRVKAARRLADFPDASIAHKLAERSVDPWAEVVEAVLDTLQKIAPQFALAAAVGLVMDGSSPSRNQIGAEFLAKTGGEALETLLDLYSTHCDSGFWSGPKLEIVADALARWQLDRALQFLSETLVQRYRRHAVSLIYLLDKNDLDQKTDVRACRHAACQEAISRLLRSEDRSVRLRTLEALGELAPPDLIERAKGMLDDGHASIRKEAVELMGQHGSVEAIEHIVRILPDKIVDVQTAAMDALADLLRHLRSEPMEIPEVSPELRRIVADVIVPTHFRDSLLYVVALFPWNDQQGPGEVSENWQEGVEFWCRVGSPKQQIQAMEILGRWGDTSSSEVLIERFEYCGDDCETVLASAVDTIIKIGRRELDAPDGQPGDDDVSKPGCIAQLKPLLRDPDEDRRSCALRALAGLEWRSWKKYAKRFLKQAAWECRQAAV